jgi:hypothetical protein
MLAGRPRIAGEKSCSMSTPTAAQLRAKRESEQSWSRNGKQRHARRSSLRPDRKKRAKLRRVRHCAVILHGGCSSRVR